MIDTRLRPYQADAVQRLLSRPDKRLILHHPTSAGKTFTALAIAHALGARRILVVTPAVTRPNWVKQFQKWYPDRVPHAVRYTAKRQTLPKKAKLERDAAYAADIKVISYNLVGDLEVTPESLPELVIVDEIHNLRNPLSQQSRCMKALLKLPIPAVGLTATLIPTEVKNVWNPVDTLFPGWYGKPAKTGDVSYRFLERYCLRNESEYGVSYSGAKQEELPKLREELEGYTHRVVESDFAHYLPPLMTEMLYIDEARAPEAIAEEWVEEECREVSHMALICYNHDTQHKFLQKFWGAQFHTYTVNGLMTPEARQFAIDQYEREGGLLLATSESVREGIDLSFVDSVLVFEWRTSPASAIQLLGRFARSNRTKALPTRVKYVAMPGEDARAEKLEKRLQAIQAVAKADAKSEILSTIFKQRELDESMLDSMFEAMFAETHLSLAEGDDDE